MPASRMGSMDGWLEDDEIDVEVSVPDLIGLPLVVAQRDVIASGLRLEPRSADGVRLMALDPDEPYKVFAQVPDAGATTVRGAIVQVWLDHHGRGGAAGVREPRRPGPGHDQVHALSEPEGLERLNLTSEALADE